MASRIPILLCGQSAAIGRGVIQGLEPRVEVVRFFTSVEQAMSEIPSILSGTFKLPSSEASEPNLGSGTFNPPPEAVVLGGAYDESAVDAIRKACQEKPAKLVPFFLADSSKPAPPLGPEYGKAITKRCLEALQELRNGDGKIKAGEVVWY